MNYLKFCGRCARSRVTTCIRPSSRPCPSGSATRSRTATWTRWIGSLSSAMLISNQDLETKVCVTNILITFLKIINLIVIYPILLYFRGY